MIYDLVIIVPPSPFLTDENVIPTLSPILLKSWLETNLTNKKNIKIHYAGKGYEIPESRYYGISFTTPQLRYAKEIYKYLKDKYPNIPVIGGGPHITVLPKESIGTVCDLACVGYGEWPLLFLLDANYSGMFVKPEDSLQTALSYKFNKLPPIYTYKNVIMNYEDIDISKYSSWLLITDIGCVKSCNFCYKMERGKVIYYPVEFIFNQIKQIPKDKFIKLTSDNVFYHFDWYKQFIEKIKDYRYEIVGRLDDITEENIKFLKDNNCEIIKVGLESGSQKILDLMNKRITLDKINKGFDILNKYNMNFGVYLIVDYPGETNDDLIETAKLVAKINPNQVSIYNYTPYPGTKDWNNKVDNKDEIIKFGFQSYYHASNELSEKQKYLYKLIDEYKSWISYNYMTN